MHKGVKINSSKYIFLKIGLRSNQVIFDIGRRVVDKVSVYSMNSQ